MPPLWLIRLSVASVWIYEGLWCKVLGRAPKQEAIVEAVPVLGSGLSRLFLVSLGWFELFIGLWILSGRFAWWAALTQTALLIPMNSVGLAYAREQIHDPPGMVLKNIVLLVLAWVAAAGG